MDWMDPVTKSIKALEVFDMDDQQRRDVTSAVLKAIDFDRLHAEHTRYRGTLERIVGQGIEALKAYYDGRGIAGTLPAAQRMARDALK